MTEQTTQTATEPLLLTVEQTAALLSMKADAVRYLYRVRQLRGVVVCHKLRFARAAVEQFVRELEQG